MIEQIVHPEKGVLAKISILGPNIPDELRDQALLWRAVELSAESAFNYGQDLPVGAVAAQGHMIGGRYYASDRRFGGGVHTNKHAEVMADLDAQFNWLKEPDTFVVSAEPCDACQDYLASRRYVKRVGFGISRQELAERGLVKPHGETIFDRVHRLGYPYEVVQIDFGPAKKFGTTILDFTSRDPQTEQVSVDRSGLEEAFREQNII